MTMGRTERKYYFQLVLYFVYIVWTAHVSAQDGHRIVNLTAMGELQSPSNITCILSEENGTATWLFEGKPLDINGSSGRINVTEDKIPAEQPQNSDGTDIYNKRVSLMIADTVMSDAGVYTCRYETEQKNATLDLWFNGSLVNHTGRVNTTEGKNASLVCVFSVYNTTKVSWYKVGAEDTILNGENTRKLDEKQIESVLVVHANSADEDNGTYVCETVDPRTKMALTGRTDVLIFRRPKLTLEKLIAISDTEMYLKWTVNSYNAVIRNYSVQLSKNTTNAEYAHWGHLVGDDANRTSMVLRSLNRSTAYIVNLTVYTDYGSDKVSEINATLSKKPDFVPDISIKGFSSTSVTIGWEPPPLEIAHLIHYYLLEARKKNTETIKKAYHSWDSRNLPYMFDNLEPHSTYLFKVHACSEYPVSPACGNWSREMEAATLDGEPSQPHNARGVCASGAARERHMNVTWEAPLQPNAEIKGYTIDLVGTATYIDRYGVEKTDTWGPLSKFMTNDSRSAGFIDLQPNTRYEVRISALTRTRKRGAEAALNCTTEPAAPAHPPRPHWRKIQLENDRYVFKMNMPRISERSGPICCYRVYMMRLPAHTQWNRMALPGDVPVLRYARVHAGAPLHAAYITDVFSNAKFPNESDLIMGDQRALNLAPDDEQCARCRRVPRRGVAAAAAPGPEPVEAEPAPSTTTEPEDDDGIRERRDTGESDSEVHPEDGELDQTHNYTLFVELIPWRESDPPLFSDYLNELMAAPTAPPPRPLTTIELALQVTCGLAAGALLLALAVCAVQARRSRKASGAQNTFRFFPISSRQPARPEMPPIAKEDLPAAYAERQADSDYGFQREFECDVRAERSANVGKLLQMLPDCFADRTAHASEARENQPKNRYPDIKAYDQTRVRLAQVDGVTGSDYINANYVSGYQERKKFICAQGPTDTTVNDFWRMIWEHGLELIVMLTNLEEYSKVKCSKYWPDEVRGSRAFGHITVHHVSEKRFSDYIVRELKITKQPTTTEGQPIVENNGMAKKNGDIVDAEQGSAPGSPREGARTVRQYHFLAWNDFAAPENPHSLLKFIKRVNEAWSGLMGRPVVVHCSAGVGRTGTLVALDCLLDQLRDQGQVAIFNTVVELRRQRNFLVQSLKQYVFVYRALVEFAHYGDTEVPASRLKAAVDRLRSTPDGAAACLMEHEFQRLVEVPVCEPLKSCAKAAAEEVRARNRSVDALPYDANRVILAPLPGRDASTYINASFIEAYDNTEGFIITQDPLPTTVADFWRMVSEHNVSTIVMLSELGEGKCPRYWEDGCATYEHISVQYEDSESCPYYTRRQFRVTNNKNGDVTSVRQLQYQGWPTAPGHVPEVTRGLASLADAALPAAPPAAPPAALLAPMLVHCQLGTERSSLFVALCVLITQLRVERRVDVAAVARRVRQQRARTIDTFLQYEFLYRAILNYAELHNLLEDR